MLLHCNAAIQGVNIGQQYALWLVTRPLADMPGNNTYMNVKHKTFKDVSWLISAVFSTKIHWDVQHKILLVISQITRHHLNL